MKKYFGTDGIRGKANTGLITSDIAMKLGAAAGSLFTRGSHRHIVVIGKDTRLSGYMLEPALTAGFISVGMDVVLLGPIPTPSVAMLTKSLRADLGIMISASHNPYYDNGIKIFDPNGYKLSNDIELEIEKRIDGDISQYLADSKNLGKARRLDDAAGRYIEYVKSTFPKGMTLEGLTIVIDCANGATYNLGPTILWELGANVIPIGINPNGFNINDNCGSNNPEILKKEVLNNNADIGIAIDGDGDRVVIVDELGNIASGDQLLALVAKHCCDNNSIKGDAVIATVMSNIGLERYLNSIDLSLIRTDVGDKNVMSCMIKTGANIGGEQSGHIILSDYSTTGDGLIAALQVLSVIVEKDEKASKVLNLFDSVPQILKNISYEGESPLDRPEIIKIIKDKEIELRNNGRILVRKSGTEKLIRIMVEGDNYSMIESIAEEIAQYIYEIR